MRCVRRISGAVYVVDFMNDALVELHLISWYTPSNVMNGADCAMPQQCKYLNSEFCSWKGESALTTILSMHHRIFTNFGLGLLCGRGFPKIWQILLVLTSQHVLRWNWYKEMWHEGFFSEIGVWNESPECMRERIDTGVEKELRSIRGFRLHAILVLEVVETDSWTWMWSRMNGNVHQSSVIAFYWLLHTLHTNTK